MQALPSLHGVPSVAGGLEQSPVEGLQVPATWHWSLAVHTTGLAPTQLPAWQVSVWVQALPSLHALASGSVLPMQAPPWQMSSYVHGLLSSQDALLGV